MVEGISEEELYKHQFMGFVALLTNSAMQQLGKLVNPATGKAERNLEGAKATIDMVKMLQIKTKGNLSKEEQQVLDTSLSSLQLNYVDELNRKDQPAPAPEKPDTAAGEKTSDDTTQEAKD